MDKKLIEFLKVNIPLAIDIGELKTVKELEEKIYHLLKVWEEIN
ncbi:hypothetical protein OCA16_25900 [Bacillus cereus]|nr:hypothetical protein [Bacillus cereus]